MIKPFTLFAFCFRLPSSNVSIEPSVNEFARFENQNEGEIEMGDNDENSLKEKQLQSPTSSNALGGYLTQSVEKPIIPSELRFFREINL